MTDDVAAALKQAQASSGASFKAVVNETLRRGLVNGAPKSRKRQRRAVIPMNLGVYPEHNIDKTWELIEKLEGPAYR